MKNIIVTVFTLISTVLISYGQQTPISEKRAL